MGGNEICKMDVSLLHPFVEAEVVFVYPSHLVLQDAVRGWPSCHGEDDAFISSIFLWHHLG